MRVAGATDELTVDYDDLERQLVRPHACRRVRARVERDRLGRGREAHLRARARGGRDLVDRCGALRGARADRRARARLRRAALLAVQVLRAASRHRVRAARARRDAGGRTRRARPPSTPVGRKFETGTLPYELLAGFSATIAYLDSIGGHAQRSATYERELGDAPDREPAGERRRSTGRRRWTDACRRSSSTSTASRPSTRRTASPSSGFGVWYADNWYCVSLGPRLPEQSLRAGIAHYNTRDEVDRLLEALTL